MRKLLTAILILIFSESTLSQNQTGNCPVLNNNINVFITGYKDTVQPNGLSARIITTSHIVNGFELVSNDSSVIIKGYHIVFDNLKTLYSKTTRNSWILDDEPQIVPLQKIKEAKFITIDRIAIEYHGSCYLLRPQFYYIQ